MHKWDQISKGEIRNVDCCWWYCLCVVCDRRSRSGHIAFTVGELDLLRRYWSRRVCESCVMMTSPNENFSHVTWWSPIRVVGSPLACPYLVPINLCQAIWHTAGRIGRRIRPGMLLQCQNKLVNYLTLLLCMLSWPRDDTYLRRFAFVWGEGSMPSVCALGMGIRVTHFGIKEWWGMNANKGLYSLRPSKHLKILNG